MSVQGGFRSVLISLALFASPAAATVISGDTWYQFSFPGPGATAGCNPADPGGSFCVPSSGTPTSFGPPPPWEITLAETGSFTVTDAFLSGDEFDVFDFGVLIGSTSTADIGGNCGNDPVPCLADPEISSGVFLLASGAHELTIVASDALAGGGTAYFRVDTEVAEIPEPASFAMLAWGALLLAWRRLTA